MLKNNFQKILFFYIFTKLTSFVTIAKSDIIELIKNSESKLGNSKVKKIDTIKKKDSKKCCNSGKDNDKNEKEKPKQTGSFQRLNSQIIENLFKIIENDYDTKEKKYIFDKIYNSYESKKNNLDLNISEFIKIAEQNVENDKENSKKNKKQDTWKEPKNNIDFYNNVFFLKYLSEFITVCVKTISDTFIEETINFFTKQKRKIDKETMISYSDFEKIICRVKENHLNSEGIKNLLQVSLGKLKANNPIKRIFLDKNKNVDLLTDVLNFLSEFNIFDKIKEIKIDDIKFENIILTILENVLKNSDKQFSLLKKMNDDEFDKAIKKFSKYLEFNIEIKLNNYNDFINKKNDNNGFSIEDYILIFKFVDFCSGNLDTFDKSSKLYNSKIGLREIKNNELLNLAGIEVIENLKKNGIIDYKEITEKVKNEKNEENEVKFKKYIITDKEKFKKEFKIKFNDLQYIFNLIKSIDIYMYFDNTNKENIYKRYNKSQIIYDVYNKSDNIVNNIKLFKEKLKENDSENINIFTKTIKESFTYLYSKSRTGDQKEVAKANGSVLGNIWNIVIKGEELNYDRLCSKISKLNIISNKDYFGIYCDQNTTEEK